MNAERFSQIAKWLLAAFAGPVMIFLLSEIFKKDGNIVAGALYVAFLTGWLCAPAALAAMFVARSTQAWTSLSFLAAEIVVICSSAWLLLPVFLVPDAQNGIALAFLPMLQIFAVIIFVGLMLFVKMMLAPVSR